jgi:Secretion system C-terminal sorting domain
MKKIYILSMLAMFAFMMPTFAQNGSRKTDASAKAKKLPYNKKYYTGLEGIDETKPDVPPSAFARVAAKGIGFTNYDLQSNAASKPRIVNLGGGKVSAAWTFGTGELAAGVPDRGTGYNSNTSGSFPAFGNKRVETARSGFTNICADAKGTEYTFAHASAPSGNKIIMSKKAAGATTWTQSDVPMTGVNSIWPFAAIGGTNGNTIHLVTRSDGSNTVKFQGIAGAMLYYRSLDGGTTWDKVSVVLPGVDSLSYVGMGGDAYTVTAKGNTVAIAYFGGWEDTSVWISQDNGNTWTKKVVYKFPLPLYKIDEGYDVALFPRGTSSVSLAGKNAPADGAIFTTDGTGSVFIDKNNKVHVMFGNMYVADTDLTDASSSYYPGSNGLIHWDETYKKDSLLYVEAWADRIQDDSITIGATGKLWWPYFNSATCWPSTAVGPDGKIYTVYSAPDEKRKTSDGDLYRSIFVINSNNNGKTWSVPYEIISDPKYLDPKTSDVDPEIAECTFPSIASITDDGKLHIVYQIDDALGLHVQGTAANPIAVSDNYINYVTVNIAELPSSAKDITTPATFDFTISPNPAREEVRLAFELKAPSDVKVTMTDLAGRIVKSNSLGRQSAGKNTYVLGLDVAAGLYFVQLNINGQIATQKVVVR